MKRTSLLIAGVLVALAPVAAAWGKDVAGRYSLAGRNPGGSGSYSGTVEVTRTGEIYQVVWTVAPGGTVYQGIGIQTGSSFAVGYPQGVAAYTVNPDGSLTGLWAASGSNQVGQEDWTPSR